MIAHLLAQAGEWQAPTIDWHAIAPELILIVGINIVLGTDLLIEESRKWATATLTGVVLLAACIPLVTLAVVGDSPVRSLFDGRYVVDEFSLILKALFLLAGYVVVLMSQTELEEGGYYQGEFYVLLLCSVLGMVMMTSSRDLVSIFVALELLSIPAYMMAAWRKRDPKSNEAGVKYYLLGVFASAVLLYGMSLLYGATGSTLLVDIGAEITDRDLTGLEVVAIAFVIAGFGFKISAVPFHTWAPDTYEGAPTPVTAFLSVASKAAGFVALILVIFIAFPQADDVYGPLIWVLSALTMTVGNVIALRQTNIVRLAGLLQRQPGRVHPDAAGVRRRGRRHRRRRPQGRRHLPADLRLHEPRRLRRRHRRVAQDPQRQISSFGGLITYAPGSRRADDAVPGLAGRDPAVRRVDRQVQRLRRRARRRHDRGVRAGRHRRRQHRHRRRVLPQRHARDVDEGGARRRPHADRHAALRSMAALAITAAGTLVLGVLPGLVMRFADIGDLTGALGG